MQHEKRWISYVDVNYTVIISLIFQVILYPWKTGYCDAIINRRTVVDVRKKSFTGLNAHKNHLVGQIDSNRWQRVQSIRKLASNEDQKRRYKDFFWL